MIDAVQWDIWLEKCTQLLTRNQAQGDGYRYTRPAPATYDYQWLWDSAFHSLAYRWFDPDMAKDELLSLTKHQVQDGPDAGMLPHMIYWPGGAAPLWGLDERSIITQPSLVAVAARQLYDRSPDTGFLKALYPSLVAYQQWLDRRRDPDADHLVSIIHPWESAWDASPRWDGPLHLDDPSDEESKAARFALVKTLMAYNCDAQELTTAGYFSVEALDYNAMRVAELDALSEIAALLEQQTDAQYWLTKSNLVREAIVSKMIQSGEAYDLAGPDEQPIRQPSTAPFILLYGRCISDTYAAQLVHRMLQSRFWTPFPVATTPTDDARFRPDSYVRGNMWTIENWLIYQGLRHYGYTREATHILERNLAVIAQSGFREFYNPLTGEGRGSRDHSTATAVLDMLAVELSR